MSSSNFSKLFGAKVSSRWLPAMTPWYQRRFLFFSPLGWAGVVAAVVALVIFTVGFDAVMARILFTAQWRAQRAVADAVYAEGDAAAQTLTAEGERTLRRSESAWAAQQAALAAITAAATTEARSAPDANEPLPADRADRLRDHDRELCRLAPASCSEPATAAAQ